MSESFAELQSKYDRLKRLYEVGQVIHSTLEPQQALQLIIDQAVQLMNAASGSIVLVNPNTGWMDILAARGLSAQAQQLKLRVGEGITGWVARKGKAVLCADVTRDKRYVSLRPEVRSELAVPLEVNGEVRGVINVDSDSPGAFSTEHQETLEALAVQASRVIQNTWLYEQLRLKVRLFESLASVSQTINSTLNLDDVLNVITREACQLMQAKMCSLLLLDEAREWLDLRASHGAGESYTRKPRLYVGESLLGIVVRRRKPVQIENVQVSGLYQHVDVAQREGLVSLLSVPLIFSGRAVGTLNVYTGVPYHFSNEEIRILSALAELSAIAIEKARLYERVVDVEEQLRQNEKLSALGLLAAEVAHEIRNPLTVLKMLYHSLDLHFSAQDPKAKDARIIEEKIEQMNKIVEQILAFARTSEPQLSPVKVEQLIEETALLVRHKLKNQNVQLDLELSAGLPEVLGDGTQLRQAFLNLVLNAAEAMPGGGRLTISARGIAMPRRNPNLTHLQIDFADTGHGMTEEQRRKLFSSVLRSTKPHGTGLGLPIVRRIVEGHGGKISVKSKPERGATFRIVLPVVSPTPAAT